MVVMITWYWWNAGDVAGLMVLLVRAGNDDMFYIFKAEMT